MRQHGMSIGRFKVMASWTMAVALCLLLSAIGNNRVPAQQPPVTPSASPDIEELDPVDGNVMPAGARDRLGRQLAVIESNIAEAWKAHHLGEEERARALFSNAMTQLLIVRKDYLEDADENLLVRMENLRRGRFASVPFAETFRPLTSYINAWISQMPEALQQEMEKRYGQEARSSLRRAVASQRSTALRDHVERYFFTEAGLTGVDRLVNLAFEQGEFLEAASWLSLLREARPSAWRARPGRHLRLMAALSVLNERELLTEAEAQAREWFGASRVMAGKEELPFMAAFERMRSQVATASTAAPVAFASIGKPTSLRLAPQRELMSEGVTRSTWSNRGMWIEESYGWGSQTHSHLEPLITADGVLAPRLTGTNGAQSGYLWFPNFDSPHDWRGLAISPARNYVHVPAKASRNFWFGNSGGTPPDQRVFGLAHGELTVEERDGDSIRRIPILAGTMGTGTSQTGQRTGNQIYVFDASAEGRMLMVLPLASQVDLGLTIDAVMPEGMEEDKPAPDADAAPSEDESEADQKESKENFTPEQVGRMLGTTHFGGIPVIRDGLLYVCGSVKDTASTELRILCFDLTGSVRGTPGTLVWHRKISAIESQKDYYSMMRPLREAATLTVSSNRLLVSTNHGSAACVDIRDGEILWLVRYRLNDNRSRSSSAFARRSYGMTPMMMRPEPTLLSGTTALVAPSDGQCLLAIDARSGQVQSTHLAGERQYDGAYYFLGEWGGRGYVQTAVGIVSEPISYSGLVDSGKGGTELGAVASTSGAPKSFHSEYLPRIRGLISPTGGPNGEPVVLVAGRQSLFRFHAATLKLIDTIPWPRTKGDVEEEAAKPNARPTTTSATTASRLWRAGQPGAMHLIPARGETPARLLVIDATAMRLFPLLPKQ